MKVVITGAAGRLARVLIPRLLADPHITAIHGVDLKPLPFAADPRLIPVQADIRDAACAEQFERADVLIHMAFVLMGGGLGRARHDRETVRAINVAGSRHVIDTAMEACVERVVFVSSAAVYGAWPDLPNPVSEDTPLRPLPGFAYGEDKAAVEAWLDSLEAKFPHLHLIRLRPHAIVGPHAHPLLNRLLHQPFVPALPRPLPLTQCVGEDDVAHAIHLSLRSAARGAFNLATDPPMSLKAMIRANRRFTIPVPLSLISAAHRLAWWVTPTAGEPGWIDGLRHSLVLDTQRARDELGWTARRDTRQCLKWEVGSGNGLRGESHSSW
jgi:UDP-glucose 4-epimerase